MTLPVSKLIERQVPWMTSSYKNQDVILHSQVSLSRNLRDQVFPGWATRAQAEQLVGSLLPFVQSLPAFQKGYASKLTDLTELEKQLLLERGVIDSCMMARATDTAFALSPNQNLCLWVNGEEHLRLISTQPGLNLQKAWKLVSEQDKVLGDQLPYAHMPNLGYLQSSPGSTGSGLQVKLLVNVPGLLLSDNLETTSQALEALEYDFESIGSEDEERPHSLYMISSHSSQNLVPEEQVIKQLTRIANELQKQELNLRAKILTENKLGLTDLVCKALAILKHARLMSMHDVIDKLFIVRLGVSMGILTEPDLKDLSQLFLNARAGYLCNKYQYQDTLESRDCFLSRKRADLLREFFASIPIPIN